MAEDAIDEDFYIEFERICLREQRSIKEEADSDELAVVFLNVPYFGGRQRKVEALCEEYAALDINDVSLIPLPPSGGLPHEKASLIDTTATSLNDSGICTEGDATGGEEVIYIGTTPATTFNARAYRRSDSQETILLSSDSENEEPSMKRKRDGEGQVKKEKKGGHNHKVNKEERHIDLFRDAPSILSSYLPLGKELGLDIGRDPNSIPLRIFDVNQSGTKKGIGSTATEDYSSLPRAYQPRNYSLPRAYQPRDFPSLTSLAREADNIGEQLDTRNYGLSGLKNSLNEALSHSCGRDLTKVPEPITFAPLRPGVTAMSPGRAVYRKDVVTLYPVPFTVDLKETSAFFWERFGAYVIVTRRPTELRRGHLSILFPQPEQTEYIIAKRMVRVNGHRLCARRASTVCISVMRESGSGRHDIGPEAREDVLRECHTFGSILNISPGRVHFTHRVFWVTFFGIDAAERAIRTKHISFDAGGGRGLSGRILIVTPLGPEKCTSYWPSQDPAVSIEKTAANVTSVKFYDILTIDHISSRADESELIRYFRKLGLALNMMNGYAYASIRNTDQGKKVLASNPHFIDGRHYTVGVAVTVRVDLPKLLCPSEIREAMAEYGAVVDVRVKSTNMSDCTLVHYAFVRYLRKEAALAAVEDVFIVTEDGRELVVRGCRDCDTNILLPSSTHPLQAMNSATQALSIG